MSWELLAVKSAAPLLLRDRLVRAGFGRQFPTGGPQRVQEILWGAGLDGDEEDCLNDLLVNEGRDYVRYSAPGPDGDAYHIVVRGLGGIYFVGATEFDNVGLFASTAEAEDDILTNWFDLLPGRKVLRPPFRETALRATGLRPRTRRG